MTDLPSNQTSQPTSLSTPAEIKPAGDSVTSEKKSADNKKPLVKKGSQGGLWAWHGMRISRLLRLFSKGPSVSLKNFFQLATLLATAPHNSFYHKIEMLRFGSRIKKTEVKPPIIILGHWRSGTTLLHNLMALDPDVTYPNTYQTLFPDHFLTTEAVTTWLTAKLVPSTRPMDNMSVGWKTTQEDELALLNMSLISPYLLLAFHGRPELYNPYMTVEGIPAHEIKAWKDALTLFMKKLTIRDDKTIVLKSPSHTFRVPLLMELFPNAKFVYIYRNPYAVAPSSFHLRRTICEVNCMGPMNMEPLEREVLDIYAKSIQRYEETKHLIPPDNLYEIKYEDLEEDPYGQIEKIYHKLNLPNFDKVGPQIQEQLPSLKSYKKNRFSMPEELQQRIYRELRLAFDTYGYSESLDG
jgi:hypothetical protein